MCRRTCVWLKNEAIALKAVLTPLNNVWTDVIHLKSSFKGDTQHAGSDLLPAVQKTELQPFRLLAEDFLHSSGGFVGY